MDKLIDLLNLCKIARPDKEITMKLTSLDEDYEFVISAENPVTGGEKESLRRTATSSEGLKNAIEEVYDTIHNEYAPTPRKTNQKKPSVVKMTKKMVGKVRNDLISLLAIVCFIAEQQFDVVWNLLY